jgi:hypothetical protein
MSVLYTNPNGMGQPAKASPLGLEEAHSRKHVSPSTKTDTTPQVPVLPLPYATHIMKPFNATAALCHTRNEVILCHRRPALNCLSPTLPRFRIGRLLLLITQLIVIR